MFLHACHAAGWPQSKRLFYRSRRTPGMGIRPRPFFVLNPVSANRRNAGKGRKFAPLLATDEMRNS